MNTSLFRSWHLLWGSLVVVGFVAWPYLADPVIQTSWRQEYRFTFLLVSGWTASGLMVIVALYSLRKHIHWLGLSPETRNVPSTAHLEKAGTRINALRREIRQGLVQERSEILEKARRIITDEGMNRAVRVSVVVGTEAGLPFDVEVQNREPLGRVATWMHAHLYYGLAAGVLVWLHGGGSFESPMGATLNITSLTVIITGVIGIFLYALGPRWLTRLERDLSFEEAFVLDKSFRKKLVETIAGLDADSSLHRPIRALLREARRGGDGYPEMARALLQEARSSDEATQELVRDVTVLGGQAQRVGRDLRGLSRVKFWMNAWRAVHIPSSVLLLGLIVIHIASVYWY